MVGRSSSGEACLQLLENTAPDILLLDPGLPDWDGLLLIPSIRQKQPQTRIILLLSVPTENALVRAANLGVSGVVAKSQSLLDRVSEIQLGHLRLSFQERYTYPGYVKTCWPPTPMDEVVSSAFFRLAILFNQVHGGSPTRSQIMGVPINPSCVPNVFLQSIFDYASSSNKNGANSSTQRRQALPAHFD